MARQSRNLNRKRPLGRLGLGILLTGGFGLLIAQTAPQVRALFDPVRAIAGDRLVSTSEPNFIDRITGRSARDQRILELEAEVRDLARWKAAAISMAERMERYESILNVLGEPPARGVTGRVVAESEGPFTDTILVNAGITQGVEPGSIAVNEGGLVGRVVTLGERSARILLVRDFNSRVPVVGEASGLHAILYGDSDGLGVLTDRPETGRFTPGERILTSGEAGVFPRGLVVGEVVAKGSEDKVILAMTKARSGFVRLLPPSEIPVPEALPEGASTVLADGAEAQPGGAAGQ